MEPSAVQRRRGDAPALAAARHGRVVDRLDIDAVVREEPVGRGLAGLQARRPPPAGCGSAYRGAVGPLGPAPSWSSRPAAVADRAHASRSLGGAPRRSPWPRPPAAALS